MAKRLPKEAYFPTIEPIFARAADMEPSSTDVALTVEDMVAVAAEVGLSPEHVERAAVERRVVGWIGQPAIVAQRRTTREASRVFADAERRLHRRHLDRMYRGPSWSLWAQRRGWWPDTARLTRGGRLALDVTDRSGADPLVTLAAEVRYVQLDHVIRLVGALAVAALAAVLLGFTFLGVSSALAIVAASLAGSWLGYRWRIRRIQTVVIDLLQRVAGGSRAPQLLSNVGPGGNRWS